MLSGEVQEYDLRYVINVHELSPSWSRSRSLILSQNQSRRLEAAFERKAFDVLV